MQPSNQSSYDFIMNPQQKHQGPNIIGPKKILLILGFIAIVLIAIMIIFSLIFSGKSDNINDLLSVRSSQLELKQTLKLGVKDINNNDLKNQFTTLSIVIESDAVSLNSILKDKTKLPNNKINSKKINDTLDAAKKKGQFDTVFEKTITEIANDYQNLLSKAMQSSSSKKTRQTLQIALNNLQTIAKN